jgi:phosphatidylserine/phosphatidylglycerophosphate/cardiolipin synthase-like enzyme
MENKNNIDIIIGIDYRSKVLPYILTAKQSIKIFMYDWRWYENDISCDVSLINSALISAHRRGVKVQAVTNNDIAKNYLSKLGIEARQWNKSKAMHAKCIVIDDHICVLGSHNLTQNAMGLNIELSCVFIDDLIAKQLVTYFENLWSL